MALIPWSLYGTMTDPDLQRGLALQQWANQMQQAQGDATGFAQQAQQQAAASQQQLMGALQQPMPEPQLSFGELGPYLGATMASAMTRNPIYQQRANQSIDQQRDEAVRRRAAILSQLGQQHQRAADEAERAGNVARSMQLQQKALTATKQYEQALESIGEREAVIRKAGEERRQQQREEAQREFQRWQTMYIHGRDRANSKIEKAAEDPRVKARLQALKEAFDGQTAAELRRLELATMDRSPRGEAEARTAMQRMSQLQERYIADVDSTIARATSGRNLAGEPAPLARSTDPRVTDAAAKLRAAGLTTPEQVVAHFQKPHPSQPGRTIGEVLKAAGISPDSVAVALQRAPAAAPAKKKAPGPGKPRERASTGPGRF